MKKFIGAAAFVIIALPALAQVTAGTSVPANTIVAHKGSQSFTFAINLAPLNINAGGGRLNTLLYRYYFRDNMAYRASLNLAFALDNGTNTGQSTKTTTKYNYVMPGLAAGIQRSFKTDNRLEPYIGADLIFGYSYTYNYSHIEQTDPSLPNYGDYLQTTSTAKGYNISIAPVLGLNYYLLKNLAIGAEFGTGISFIHMSAPSVATSSRVLGVSQPEIKQDSGPSQQNLEGLRPGQYAKITASVYF